MQNIDQARAFIGAIAGDPTTAIIDFRAIHDTDKTVAGHARRGTLAEYWPWLIEMNNAGYGIFATISAMDGAGRDLANVSYIRAHFVDLDNSSAQQNYEATARMVPPPTLAVNSSIIYNVDGSVQRQKFHVYWQVAPYAGNDRFQLTQRKLRQIFDGDKATVDATRVMRLPGTLHLKNPAQPHLVTCWQMPGYGNAYPIEAIETALATVNVIDGGVGVRHDLGEPSLAAPSLEWLKRALSLTDPNELDRGEWIALTSAIKQAGWTLTDGDTLFRLWSEWCTQYGANDIGENLKQWTSIRNTELGWPSLVRRVPSLQASVTFQDRDRSNDAAIIAAHGSPPPATPDGAPTAPMPEPPPLDCSGEFLTHIEQQTWFKECFFVVKRGEILVPDGTFLNATKFNGMYGGKKFIIDGVGKTTNEPWQAATRSTLWTVAKVHHTRFMPERPYHDIITDELGRRGINTYAPITPRRITGDPTPFLRHIALLLPEPIDQRILLDFLAHNIKYPGKKIPWAPVIQSVEGAGKGLLKLLMSHAMGRPYCYFPNAKELTDSGSQFNAWMRAKLFILADEIKVDDRRDLIEVLKPMISEEVIEMQGKGHDQELEDNFSNWLFFTNWKDAIPINKNGRRFSIMYSALQNVVDLLERQMHDSYFKQLYDWMKADGCAIVYDWFMNYPIERGAIAMRAPDTSSTQEALAVSRSPIERVVLESIEDALPGFRGGWVSSIALMTRIKAAGAVRGSVSPQTITTIMENMGFAACGRAARPHFQEDKDSRAYLYRFGGVADVAGYGHAQGWE